jgi:hypothetical protein
MALRASITESFLSFFWFLVWSEDGVFDGAIGVTATPGRESLPAARVARAARLADAPGRRVEPLHELGHLAVVVVGEGPLLDRTGPGVESADRRRAFVAVDAEDGGVAHAGGGRIARGGLPVAGAPKAPDGYDLLAKGHSTASGRPPPKLFERPLPCPLAGHIVLFLYGLTLTTIDSGSKQIPRITVFTSAST